MDETARLVGSKIELSEDEIEILNRKFQVLAQKLNEDKERPQVKLCYFVPDERKNGGAYVTKIGAENCAARSTADIFGRELVGRG